MAANTLVHVAPGWALREKLTSAQLTKLDQHAAQSVNRNSTHGGARCLPLRPLSQVSMVGGTLHSLCDAGGVVGDVSCGNYSEQIVLPLLDLPQGHSLISASVHVKPMVGHTGTFPNGTGVTLPRLRLYRKAEATRTSELLGDSGAYPWVDLAAYEAGFDLSAAVTAGPTPVDWSVYTYWLTFNLEGGPDSVPGLVLNNLRALMLFDYSYGGPDLSLWL